MISQAKERIFVICERDAGLFSLIQQVVANLPRALNAESIPIVYFGPNCCYWVPDGYQGKHNVWEYYFEPLLTNYSSELIPEEVKSFSEEALLGGGMEGVHFDQKHFLTNNFGDHSQLRNDCLAIPFEWNDPDDWLRRISSRLMNTFIHPQQYLLDRANAFAKQHFENSPIIGIHMRGTDSISDAEPRLFRKNSLVLNRYLNRIEIEKKRFPSAKIFVATDSASSLEAIRRTYGSDVLSCATILHSEGTAPAGKGPTGALMPAYIAADSKIAAENGAEALVDYLLLKKCNMLIHNGASLARTVLLSDPDLPHYNTHRKTVVTAFRSVSLTPRSMLRTWQKWDEYFKREKKVNFDNWMRFTDSLNNKSKS